MNDRDAKLAKLWGQGLHVDVISERIGLSKVGIERAVKRLSLPARKAVRA